MSLNLNTVMIAGHLTRDPQVKSLANARMVAEFGLAVNKRWKTPEGELKEEATFIDIETWGRTAELVGQYLTKGAPCYIEGRLRMDSWVDKEGKNRSRLKVVADNVHFLEGKKAPKADAAPAQPARVQEADEEYVAAPIGGGLMAQPPF